MNVLQTVKYYEPSNGGMESVVKNIVEGVSMLDKNTNFVVYSNDHVSSYKTVIVEKRQIKIIKETTPLIVKSQPLNLRYKNLVKLIETNDIIHHHYPFPNMEIALLRNLDFLKNKKLIITWHANIKNSRWGFIKKFYNPLIEKLLTQVEHIVVTSPQLLGNADILRGFEKKVKIIPLCFNPDIKAESAPVKTIEYGKRKKILFVGKLRVYKGLTYLIDAIAGTDYFLTIVGDGEEEIKLVNKVNKLGITNRVRFLKNISDKELTKIYQESDLFVLPSINEAEAFGVVQLEAMAHGLPVINTNLNSGVPFVSLNNVSGLTVEPQSAESLGSAMKLILNDVQLHKKYSSNSYERSKLFTREKFAQSYLDLYLS